MKSFFNKLRRPSAAACVFIYLCYFVTAIYCHCLDQGKHQHHQVSSTSEAHQAHQHCHTASENSEKNTSAKHPLCDCSKFEAAALSLSSQLEITKIYSSSVFLQPPISLIPLISSAEREWQTLGFHGPPGQTPLYITHQSFLI